MTIQEEDKLKCELLSRFYQTAKNNRELVDQTGSPKVRYWQEARRYLEPKLIEYNRGQLKTKT